MSQLFLEEQSFSQRVAQRTLGQKVRLYLLRFVLNVTVLCLLAGAFFLIYFATRTSQEEVRHLNIGRPRVTHLARWPRGEKRCVCGPSVSERTPLAGQPLPAVPAPHHHHRGQPVPAPRLPQDLIL